MFNQNQIFSESSSRIVEKKEKEKEAKKYVKKDFKRINRFPTVTEPKLQRNSGVTKLSKKRICKTKSPINFHH